MRRATCAAAVFFLTAFFFGCAGAPPDAERLRAEVARRRPAPVLVRHVGPRSLGAGERDRAAIMPLFLQGEKVAEFELYDLYFKAIFVAVEELRAAGLEARASPGLWAARWEAVRFEASRLPNDALDIELARLGAQEELMHLYRLGRNEKLDLLASRRVLFSAQTGLPPALRAKRPTAREIREAYFLAEGEPPPPLALDLEIEEARIAAEEGIFGAEREARVRLRAAFREAASGALLREEDCGATEVARGTGTRRELGGYTLAIGPDEPLDRALRGAIRRALGDALPFLDPLERR
jgi:hypothetical protein